MKNIQSIGLALFTLFIFTNINCGKEEPEVPVVRVWEDVKTDFDAIDISAGTHDEALLTDDGKTWNFRIIAPTVEASTTYPLIIHLHGASGGDPDAHKATACYVEPGFEDMDAFIISPNGGIEQWNDLDNQTMVIYLTLLAREFWPVDPDKIVVTGYSNGGNGSWFFGETQPTLFKAAIPMASSYSTISTDGSVRLMPNPMYVIHGEDDELFPLAETEDWVSQTIDAGSSIEFVVADGLGHYVPCDYVSYLKDAATWLEETIW